ncbi:hypothetical protein AVEN_32655-1 [Araneus ventricosus]|uniref:Uncharacterized protein n=1 Tax=Araneus ventricosus TaxID=182803 RepID=A0A4Y2C8W2_ARAVE|nr:hypothetical protein AVEN_32655-1 [Araneus ventricosus]
MNALILKFYCAIGSCCIHLRDEHRNSEPQLDDENIIRTSTPIGNLSWAFTRRLSYAICPKTGFFPPILVEKLDKAFTDVPKFVLRQGAKS